MQSESHPTPLVNFGMATSIGPPSSTNMQHKHDFVVLHGQNNFFPWIRRLEKIARLEDVWKILNGEEEMMRKPELEDYVKYPAGIPKICSALTTDASGPASETQDIEPPEITNPSQFKIRLELFNIHNQIWSGNRKKFLLAMELLRCSVVESIDRELNRFGKPTEAVNYLVKKYKMNDTHGLSLAYEKFHRLRRKDYENGRDYIEKMKLGLDEIRFFGGENTEATGCSKLLSHVNGPQYSLFVAKMTEMSEKETCKWEYVSQNFLMYEDGLERYNQLERFQIPMPVIPGWQLSQYYSTGNANSRRGGVNFGKKSNHCGNGHN